VSAVRIRQVVAGVCAAIGLAACAALSPGPSTSLSAPASTSASTTGPAARPAAAAARRAVELRLLFSSDEHGWLQPVKDKRAGVLRGGVHAAAATMAAEGFAVGKPGWLLLSVAGLQA
jgi:hypothetical protein